MSTIETPPTATATAVVTSPADDPASDTDNDIVDDEKTANQRGVRGDLSDLKNTLTRNFWGVASFLAPPPQPSDRDLSEDDLAGVDGVRGDLEEIGGKVRSSISKLSDNIKVSDFAKMASNILQLGAVEAEEVRGGDGGAVGVSDEVVAFARDISMHHETWLNFPLPVEDDDDEDEEFDLSDAQQDHALAVERLAPGLADLRFALCPSYMTESCFWKIYFVLLHPKLDKNDALVLSTPQILKARAFLTAELRNRPKANTNQDSFEKITTVNEISVPLEALPLDKPTVVPVTSTVDPDIEIEKHPIQSTQVPIVDKSVVNQGTISSVKDQDSKSSSSSTVLIDRYDDDGDDWLKEEGSELAGAVKSTVHIGDDEDVSFSDLEED